MRALQRASLVFALLATATIARAQGYHALFTPDGIDVWAVGDSGAIGRSLDAGADWTNSTLGHATLRGVAARRFDAIVVGDSGAIWRSSDSGGRWSLDVAPDAPRLNAIEWPDPLVAFIVGAMGTILATTDGGGSWSPQASGTTADLRAARFIDEYVGWAVGDRGTMLHTVDGGLHWQPVATGTSNDLLSVDVRWPAIWAVGVGGTARKSTNGGASFVAVPLKLDARSDVQAVWLSSPDSVFLAGGGGFIRRSVDGGRTWSFAIHPMQAPISDLCFRAGRGWAVNDRNRVVIKTADRGGFYDLPNGAGAPIRSWVQVLTAPDGGYVRGNSIAFDGTFPNTFYCALINQIFVSRDAGDTWSSLAPIPDCNRVNALIVSPRDSNVMVAAVSGGTRRLIKSDDHGQTWITTLMHDFGEYGIPLEFDPDHPDTMFFGGDRDVLYRSTDAGKNWAPWSSTVFRSPCDIVVVPDSTNIVVVGDGVTAEGEGQYWKSVDGGLTFTLKSTRPFGASEIPGLACSRLRNSALFGTNWGYGGVQRSTDYGERWIDVHAATSTWGVDASRDDPNCVIFGLYGGGSTFLSLDGGTNFTASTLLYSNYSFLLRDRSTIIAEQSNGLHKLVVSYPFAPDTTQELRLEAPTGSEEWAAGTVREIAWTAHNVAVARIQYRAAEASPWQTLAEVPGYQGVYSWTVPVDATSAARIRVMDAWDGAPRDSSHFPFTIRVEPELRARPDPFDLLLTQVGTTSRATLAIENLGPAPLTISSVTVDNPRFWTGRAALGIPAYGADTLGVWFRADQAGRDSAQLTIVADDPVGTHRIEVRGSATSSVGAEPPVVLRFALGQNQPNPFSGSTEISYALPATASVTLDVYDLQGKRLARLVSATQGAGEHRVRFAPGVRTASGERVGSVRPGVYFYRLEAGAFTRTRRMLVVR